MGKERRFELLSSDELASSQRELLAILNDRHRMVFFSSSKNKDQLLLHISKRVCGQSS